MKHRRTIVALSATTTVFATLFAACGSYDQNDKGATGGASGSTATGGTAGSMPTGGTAGTGAQGGAAGSGQPTGGSAGSGTAGTGADAGSGGAPGGSGGGGGNDSCSEVAPCGGELTGTWTAASCMLTVSGMVDMSATGLACPSAPVTGTLAVSGTWTAEAGGMFTDATTTSGELTIELGETCKEISGTSTTCDRVVLGALGLNSVTCVDNTTTMGCTCTANVSQDGRPGFIAIEHPETGTFTVDGSDLVTTGDGRTTQYAYCVSGNRLTMTLETAGAVGTVTGNIVFEKQ